MNIGNSLVFSAKSPENKKGLLLLDTELGIRDEHALLWKFPHHILKCKTKHISAPLIEKGYILSGYYTLTSVDQINR